MRLLFVVEAYEAGSFYEGNVIGRSPDDPIGVVVFTTRVERARDLGGMRGGPAESTAKRMTGQRFLTALSNSLKGKE